MTCTCYTALVIAGCVVKRDHSGPTDLLGAVRSNSSDGVRLLKFVLTGLSNLGKNLSMTFYQFTFIMLYFAAASPTGYTE